MARRAHLFTTPNATLAERYRQAGVTQIRVIENHLPRQFLGVPRRPHRGLVIGWLAGLQHAADSRRLGIPQTLRNILDRHADVQVATLGHDLGFRHPRYLHRAHVPFPELMQHLTHFDIALAPLADIPFNHSRSNIKLKEYAAAGAPWLASPAGPYKTMGDAQGGLLVDDDAWEQSIEALIADPGLRTHLAQRGRSWALTQSIDNAAREWEDPLAGQHSARLGDSPRAHGVR